MKLLKTLKLPIVMIISFICYGYILLFILGALIALFPKQPFVPLLVSIALIGAVFYLPLPAKIAAKGAAVLFGIVLIPLGLLAPFAFPSIDYPFEYEGAKWVSEEPSAYFDVIDGACIGEITIDGEATEFYLYCRLRSYDYFFFPLSLHYEGKSYYDADREELLFKGKANYGKEKITVKITDNSNGFLPAQIKKITFVQETEGVRR